MKAKTKTNSAAFIRLVKELETGGRMVLLQNSKLNTGELITKASKLLKGKGFAVCRVDFNGSKNSVEFLERLHASYCSGFFPRKSDFEKYKSIQLKKMMLSYEGHNKSNSLLVKPDMSFFDFSESDWDRTINLAEKFSKRFKKKTVVFLESFDAVCGLKDSIKLQERLRSCIQHHSGIGYCYSVSSLSSEIEIFFSYNAPFYLSASRLTS